MHIIGDVEGRTCLVVDDMVDTAGTLCKAAQALKEHGAAKVIAYCTHAVLSGNAIANIERLRAGRAGRDRHDPAVARKRRRCARIRQLSSAPLLAEAVRRVSNEESISAMFA